MLKGTLLAVGWLLVVASAGYGLTVEGDLWATTVTMQELNGFIAAYNVANDADIPGLGLGWGGELRVDLPELWQIHPTVGVRGLAALSGSEREAVNASLIGAFVGGEIHLGSWSVALDLGAYRSRFDFSAGGYNGLSGWSLGGLAKAAYARRLTPSLSATVGLTLSLLPVSELSDPEGGVYASRTGPFLDFSGVGVSIGVRWGSQGGSQG